jgi:hypothetical protein
MPMFITNQSFTREAKVQCDVLGTHDLAPVVIPDPVSKLPK